MAFEPLTAREALLSIAAESNRTTVSDSRFREIARELARLGLDQTAPPNFELTDQLADRLAEAHKILRPIIDAHEKCVEKGRENRSFIGGELPQQILEALALPPDLEAMVERRIGR